MYITQHENLYSGSSDLDWTCNHDLSEAVLSSYTEDSGVSFSTEIYYTVTDCVKHFFYRVEIQVLIARIIQIGNDSVAYRSTFSSNNLKSYRKLLLHLSLAWLTRSFRPALLCNFAGIHWNFLVVFKKKKKNYVQFSLGSVTACHSGWGLEFDWTHCPSTPMLDSWYKVLMLFLPNIAILVLIVQRTLLQTFCGMFRCNFANLKLCSHVLVREKWLPLATISNKPYLLTLHTVL